MSLTPARAGKLALAASGVLTLLLAASRIAYPHDLGQYEADVWAPANAIAHGHSPYHMAAATTPPYRVASYGPLYYALIAIGTRLFGDQFAFGRTLGLVCLILSAACVYLILRRFAGARSRAIGLLGAGLLLAQYPIQAEAGIEAPDMVGLALALAGLTVALSAPRDAEAGPGGGPGGAQATPGGVQAPPGGVQATPGGVQAPPGGAPAPPGTADGARLGRPALAGVLLAAAVLTRQTLFLPVLVALAWYALRRDRRALFVYGLVVVAIGASVFAFLQATSGGGFVWNAVQLQGDTALTFSHARTLILAYLKSPATICTLALLLTAALASRRPASPTPPGERTLEARTLKRILVVYLLAAAVLAAVTSGKVGAGINYWLEVSAVLSLLVPLLVSGALEHRAVKAPARSWSVGRGVLVLVAVTIAAAVVNLGREAHGELLQWRALPYVNEVVHDIRALTHPGELVYVEYPDLAVAAARPYVFDDLALYEDSSALVGTYRRVFGSGRLKLIVSLAPAAPAGYATVCTKHSPPAGVYDVRVYYRVTTPVAPGSCVPA